MKKKLLFIGAIIIGFISSTQAQSLTVDAVSSQEVGATIPINFQYTSIVGCALYVELRIADINGANVISQNYGSGGYVAGKFSAALPAQAVMTPATVTFIIPGSIVASTALPAGKTYSWVYKLTKGVNNYEDVGSTFQFTAATITPSTSVVNTVNATTPPTTAAAGSNVTINYNYTLVNNGGLKVEIARFTAAGNYVSGVAGNSPQAVIATTTTAVVGSLALEIPVSTPASSTIGTDVYKILVSTYTGTAGNFSYLIGSTYPITITAPSLGLNDNLKQQLQMYPNPASDVLYITGSNLDFKSISIIDMNGRTVKSIPNAEDIKSIDVSGLSRGAYIISTENRQYFKFIKQ